MGKCKVLMGSAVKGLKSVRFPTWKTWTEYTHWWRQCFAAHSLQVMRLLLNVALHSCGRSWITRCYFMWTSCSDVHHVMMWPLLCLVSLIYGRRWKMTSCFVLKCKLMWCMNADLHVEDWKYRQFFSVISVTEYFSYSYNRKVFQLQIQIFSRYTNFWWHTCISLTSSYVWTAMEVNKSCETTEK